MITTLVEALPPLAAPARRSGLGGVAAELARRLSTPAHRAPRRGPRPRARPRRRPRPRRVDARCARRREHTGADLLVGAGGDRSAARPAARLRDAVGGGAAHRGCDRAIGRNRGRGAPDDAGSRSGTPATRRGATRGRSFCSRRRFGWRPRHARARSRRCFEFAEAHAMPPAGAEFAFAAFAHGFGLVPGGGQAIFAVGRTAGWVAHAIEEHASPSPLRMRATYVGPDPADPESTCVGLPHGPAREGRQAFRRIHLKPPILVIPNAWDVASAKRSRRFPVAVHSRPRAPRSPGRSAGRTVSSGPPRDAPANERIAAAVDLPVTGTRARLRRPVGTRATRGARASSGSTSRTRPRRTGWPLDEQVEMIRAIRDSGARARDQRAGRCLVRKTGGSRRGGRAWQRVPRGRRRLRLSIACPVRRRRPARPDRGPMNVLAIPGMPEPGELAGPRRRADDVGLGARGAAYAEAVRVVAAALGGASWRTTPRRGRG